jgi:serine protease
MAPAGVALKENGRRLIVDFRDDVGPETLAATPWVEVPVSRQTAVDGLYRVDFPTEAAAEAAARALAAHPAVEAVDFDVEASLFDGAPDSPAVRPSQPFGPAAEPNDCAGRTRGAESSHAGFPNDPCYSYQWHLRQIGLPAAWRLGQGRGAIVAVIDTGVSRVPDLEGTELVAGYDFVGDKAAANDDHGHGTHVAGTIAQSTHNGRGVAGVAFGARIMPLKVLSASGSGSMAATAQAIRFAADHGAHVINMSLGAFMPFKVVGTAVRYALGKGVVVVAAAGNESRGRVSYPARYAGVIGVAATRFDETTSFYSNWGPAIDVAAPGGDTRVDQNGDGKPDGVLQNTVVPGDTSRTDYLWFMGTSMAAPHVAGVAALLVGAGIRKPEAVEALIVETAREPKAGAKASGGSARIDDRYGAGIVDAERALTKARLGRGAGGLAIGASLALAGLARLRRRERLSGRLDAGLGAGVVAGSSGLFFLPFVLGPLGLAPGLGADGAGALLATVAAISSEGLPELLQAGLGELGRGNPLVLSLLLPLAPVALLAGARRLRPALAGLCYGVAGSLAFLAVAGTVDVRLVPDLLDRPYLAVQALLAAGLGGLVLRR